MSNSEEAIDKVLAGLRDCDIPVGMERRVLEAVERRSATHSSSETRRRARIAPLLWGAVAAAVIVAVVLANPPVRHVDHRLERTPVSPAASQPPRPLESAAVEAPRPMHRVSARQAVKQGPPPEKPAVDMEALAAEEMHAPSHPPPPMPLTEQEKMLLRIMYNRNPVQLARLSSAAEEQHDVREAAEYQKFFAPPERPKTGENE